MAAQLIPLPFIKFLRVALTLIINANRHRASSSTSPWASIFVRFQETAAFPKPNRKKKTQSREARYDFIYPPLPTSMAPPRYYLQFQHQLSTILSLHSNTYEFLLKGTADLRSSQVRGVQSRRRGFARSAALLSQR